TIRSAPAAPPLPYTTLFRSHAPARHPIPSPRDDPGGPTAGRIPLGPAQPQRAAAGPREDIRIHDSATRGHGILESQDGGAGGTRSEEHTSELQSRSDLVCRL